MSPQNAAIFDVLNQAIQSANILQSDLFRGIAALTTQSPAQASAFAHHIADILQEHEANDASEMTFNDVAAEAYRRTYFDPVTAAMHGGSAALANNPKKLSEFAQFVASRMAQDAIDQAATPATVHNEPARMQ